MPGYVDKRKFQRLTLFIEVVYKVYRDYQKRLFLNDKEIQATTIDISEGGVGIQSPQSIPERSILDIVINLTNLNRKGEIIFNKPIEAVGKVRWMTPREDNSYRIGISFIKIAEEDRLTIKNFVARHLRTKEKRLTPTGGVSGRKYLRYKIKAEQEM